MIEKIKEALIHASMSEHHLKCGTHKVGGGNGCTCHVAKAKDALNDLAMTQKAVKEIEVAAGIAANHVTKNSFGKEMRRQWLWVQGRAQTTLGLKA